MLDLGTSFLASVARDPSALAIVDGDLRLTYRQWYGRISAVVAALDDMGLREGDHLVTLLQNRWEAATIHWACQFAGIVITPINWRSKADEIDFALENAEAKALVFEEVSAEAVRGATRATGLLTHRRRARSLDGEIALRRHASGRLPRPERDAAGGSADAWSIMLYTSGTTSRPKGVPRRHRTERGGGHRPCGAEPLPATGERDPRRHAALSHHGGALAPRHVGHRRHLRVPAALRHEAAHSALIERRADHQPLSGADPLPRPRCTIPRFKAADRSCSSVRKLGFAGASMTDGLLKKLDCGILARAVREPLRLLGNLHLHHRPERAILKPGSAGRAGINQMVRVVRLGAQSAGRDRSAEGEEGEIIALLAGDESFEGYWRRPGGRRQVAARRLVLHRRHRLHVDADGDLFVTGRVDDMIITGGENVSPVEIESCLSLHPAVSEVAVVGLPDEKWGKIVVAFVKRAAPVEASELDAWCRTSGLANFKRPRRFVFVAEIPKSPVGKLLRRQLVAGEYVAEADAAHSAA